MTRAAPDLVGQVRGRDVAVGSPIRARPLPPWRRRPRHLRLVWSAPAAPQRAHLRLVGATVRADRTLAGVTLTVVDDEAPR